MVVKFLKSSSNIFYQCIDQQELEDKLMTMDLVKQCSISHFGEDLLLAMGNATAELDPPHTFIPWITFNGVSLIVHRISFLHYSDDIPSIQTLINISNFIYRSQILPGKKKQEETSKNLFVKISFKMFLSVINRQYNGSYLSSYQ